MSFKKTDFYSSSPKNSKTQMFPSKNQKKKIRQELSEVIIIFYFKILQIFKIIFASKHFQMYSTSLEFYFK